MKKRIFQFIFYAFLVILFLPIKGYSQDWGGEKPNGFWDHWSINANAGLTSYFGDLSYYDTDIGGKLTYESGPAFGLLVTKHLSKKIGLSGQFLYGNLKGGNNKNLSFTTNTFEYNVQVRVDFIRLIFAERNPKFGLEGFTGIGQMLFKTTQTEYDEGSPITSVHSSRVPEFLYFAGLGMHYHFAENFAVTTSFSMRHMQNDKLDNLVKNDDFDFYSYFSVGLTYYINSPSRGPMKNKARLAHTGIRSR